MGRGGRQEVPSVRASDRAVAKRRELFDQAARRLDPDRARDRGAAWEEALVWNSLTDQGRVDFIEGIIREVIEENEMGRHILVQNIFGARYVAFTNKGEEGVEVGFHSPTRDRHLKLYGPDETALAAEELVRELDQDGFFFKEIQIGPLPPAPEPPTAREQRVAELRAEGLSEEEAEEKLQEEHWTDWHPDRKHWTEHQRALARMMTQEAYEGLYGRGRLG